MQESNWTPATGVLWQMAQEPNETRARQLRAHARECGASALDIARWWRARDERLARDVTVIGGGAA